jgi:hypothetical protein
MVFKVNGIENTFIRLIKYVAQKKALFNKHLSNARLCDLENEKMDGSGLSSCRLKKIGLPSAQSASCPKVEQSALG